MLQCCFTSTACRCCWVLLYVHRNRRLIRDGSPGWPPRLSHSSCALTYTAETIRLIRDGEPRMATSTFTQLLSGEKSGNQASLLSQESAWDAVQVAGDRDFRELCPQWFVILLPTLHTAKRQNHDTWKGHGGFFPTWCKSQTAPSLLSLRFFPQNTKPCFSLSLFTPFVCLSSAVPVAAS